MQFFSNTMNLNIKNGVGFLTFKELEKYNFINHAFSTRLGGVSSGNFAYLNLNEKNGDKYENVQENIKRFCNSVNFLKDSICFLKQEHGAKVKVVTKENLKKIENFDGSITNVKGIVLATMHADCTPIFFVDKNTKSIGIAHAGWRGTIKNIVKEVINSMSNQYGSHKHDIVCYIGPCIKSCCFEVKKDVSNLFEQIDKNLIDIRNNKIFIDMVKCNERNLINEGVRKENIYVSDLCTKCNHDLLFSYRAQGIVHGTMSAMICLK